MKSSAHFCCLIYYQNEIEWLSYYPQMIVMGLSTLATVAISDIIYILKTHQQAYVFLWWEASN